MADVSISQMFLRVNLLATEVGSEIKKTNIKIGDLGTLTTTAKASLVQAINEINAKDTTPTNEQVKAVIINDVAKSADRTYSSNKIETYVTAQVNAAKTAVKNELLGGASAAFDTLKELETALTTSGSTVAALTTAVGNKLDTTATELLDTTKQNNIAKQLGITDQDFVATFKAALA